MPHVKTMVYTSAKDHMVLTGIANETEEKADKQITAAKKTLAETMEAKVALAAAKTQAEKEATEEHNREIQIIGKDFQQGPAADNVIKEDRLKLDEAEENLLHAWARRRRQWPISKQQLTGAIHMEYLLCPSPTGT